MESGIPDDQNFYSRRPLYQTQAQPPLESCTQSQSYTQYSSEGKQQYPHTSPTYESPHLSQSFESNTTSYPPPPHPPKLPLLTTSNLQAITVNGFMNDSTGGGEPDDFYRGYRGVQQSANGNLENPKDMPATSSDTRPIPPVGRSNINGNVPKNTAMSNSTRNPAKPPTLGSSSSQEGKQKPTVAKPPLNGFSKSTSQPSVKDLLRKFDQQNNDQSLPMPRRPVARTSVGPSSGLRDRPNQYTARTASNPAPPTTSSTLRAGNATRDAVVKSPSSATRSVQRTRFVAEDQHSNNALSSVPRTTRIRTTPAVKANTTSKSMGKIPPATQTSRPPPPIPEKRPLFGEVLTLDPAGSDVGFGIPRAPMRRTSDSNLPPMILTNTQSHNQADVDISPTSPSAWYLGVTPSLGDVAPNKPRKSGHNRAHSDFADTRVNTLNNIDRSSFLLPESSIIAKESQREEMMSPRSQAASPTKSSSKLPVALKRLSNASDSSSPSRASSPLTRRPAANGRFPKAEQRPWSPANRTMTPVKRTSTPTNRTSTPTNTSSRSKTRSPQKATSSNGSLKAYISAPPTRDSPPLRSSRPRQPVSAASTASSRQRAMDRSSSPHSLRSGMKVTRTGDKVETKPRKIADIGPVDFAARRARITRAYTKSIHESEQQKIRAENLRVLKSKSTSDESKTGGLSTTAPEAESSSKAVPDIPPIPEPLQIVTSFEAPISVASPERQAQADQDSPTLGVAMGMPGDFVEKEVPMSAMSTVSTTTFIENEAQIEAARLAGIPPLNFSGSTLAAEHGHEVDDVIAANSTSTAAESGGQTPGAVTPIDDTQQDTPTQVSDVYGSTAKEIPCEQPHALAFEQSDIAPAVGLEAPVEGVVESNPIGFQAVDFANATGHATQVESCDASPRQSMEMPLTIEVPSEQSCKQPDRSMYLEIGEIPRLEVPTLRAALAESPSVGTDDERHDINTPTDIDYESYDEIDAGNTSEQEDLYGPSYDQNRELYLTSDYYHRESRHSGWTDFSMATTENSSAQDENQRYRHTEISFDEPERRPTPPPKLPPSPAPQQLVQNNEFSISDGSGAVPLTTHNGFGLGFDPDTVYSIPTIPHWTSATPPPPNSGQLNQLDVTISMPPPTRTPPPPSASGDRPSSSMYQSSHNDTNGQTESRRASDDLYSPRVSLSTPRSSTHYSQEDICLGQGSDMPPIPQPPLSEEQQEIAKGRSKRLFTRRKIIEELIDTESVYVKDLNVVEEIYKGTAEACPKLDGSDIKTIFRNTDEIIAFTTRMLDDLKLACAPVYTSKSRSRQSKATVLTVESTSTTDTPASIGPDDPKFHAAAEYNDMLEEKDRKTCVGHVFGKHLHQMQILYTEFLKNSELASSRLKTLEEDPAVKVWLVECNHVAKDLTAAWDLDALLVKPVQRITRYQLLLLTLSKHTPDDHPDYSALHIAMNELLKLLKDIDDLKKRIHMVGKIVGRKRKESEVRNGLAKAFRRLDKAPSDIVRPHDDELYAKLHEKFNHDYLQLQVVLRDVEYYTRQVGTYVADFLRYLSSMELVMRMSASAHPEIESRWSQFSLSMRDMGSVALEAHVNDIRQRVIIPFEQVIQTYSPPTLAMKKRAKRRVDYEKYLVHKTAGKKIDDKLKELVSQYEALNETLKLELPKLSALTEKIGRICLGNLVGIQTSWYHTWQEKVKTVLDANQMPKDTLEIVHSFNRDYKYVQARAQELSIVNGTFREGGVWSGAISVLEGGDPDPIAVANMKESSKSRRSNSSHRPTGLTLSPNDKSQSPSLPTPEFAKRHSGQFSFSPIIGHGPGLPHAPYQPAAYSNSHSRVGSGSPVSPDPSGTRMYNLTRPTTSRSLASDNGCIPRVSTETSHRRESNSTQASASYLVDGPLRDHQRPFSGIFHSAMPLADGPEDSARSSRASSIDRTRASRYNVIYLAASLFEFNIAATKTEAGYPYLTYSAGEIFDVIGEKGELWLAKNQDDESDQVGWIWSKHFARLAAD